MPLRVSGPRHPRHLSKLSVHLILYSLPCLSPEATATSCRLPFVCLLWLGLGGKGDGFCHTCLVHTVYTYAMTCLILLATLRVEPIVYLFYAWKKKSFCIILPSTQTGCHAIFPGRPTPFWTVLSSPASHPISFPEFLEHPFLLFHTATMP